MSDLPESPASTAQSKPPPATPERLAASTTTDGSAGPIGRLLARGPTPVALLVIAVVGLFAFWPSIASPFWLDDYLHRAMVNHVYPVPRGPFELYDFVSDRDRDLLMARGILPWWTDPSLQIRFLRPLSSLLLYGDHAAMGTRPLAMHAHSYAWWLACVVGARGLFRRFFTPRVALFATVIFALGPCHAIPLGWLANREALVCLALGLFALGQHEDFRATGSPRKALGALTLFALSSAGGEYSLLLAGYVGALELFRARPAQGREPVLRRLLGVATWLVPTVTYLTVRRQFHYGAAGSGFYSDPTRDLGGFLAHAPRRFVALSLDAWLSLDGEWTRGVPAWQLVASALLVLVLLVAPIYSAFSRLDDATLARAKGLLLGSLFALVPALAVSASPRLVGASLFGVSATIAIVLEDAWFAPPAPAGALESAHAPRGQLTAVVAYALGFLHLVHAPTTSWIVGKQIGLGARTFAAHARSLGRRAPPDAEVHVVRAPNAAFFLPFALNERGLPPKQWRVLSRSSHVLATRDDARTLTLAAPRDTSLFATEDGDVFGTAKVFVGQVMKIDGMQVEVLEIGTAGPSRARFTFDKELTAEGMAWFTETVRGFPSIEPPEPGFGAPFDP